MKIAICSQNRREVTAHAGRCRRFWIYEVGAERSVLGREMLELPKTQAMHETAGDEAHPLDGVDVLISGGMGAGMRRKLAKRGVEPVTTSCTDPDTAVAGWLSRTLSPAEENSAESAACNCGH
jgi:predicted Fe-Mo cluster-binding NifX family protein